MKHQGQQKSGAVLAAVIGASMAVVAMASGLGDSKLVFNGIADRIRPHTSYDGWTTGYNPADRGHVHDPATGLPAPRPFVFRPALSIAEVEHYQWATGLPPVPVATTLEHSPNVAWDSNSLFNPKEY